jgi:hypothetical protein
MFEIEYLHSGREAPGDMVGSRLVGRTHIAEDMYCT